jgi:hypothetical protein
MALALASAIATIERATVRRIVCAGVVALAVASWVPAAIAYYGLAYPPDVLYSLGIDSTRVPPERKLCELTPGTSYASPGPLDRTTRYPYTNESDYLLINFCQGPPSSQRLNAVDTQHRALLYEGPHFLTFPAYAFEGFTPAQREEI